MKEVLTFILPTRNRKQYVRRAVDSCLQCQSDNVSPFVIVIDGESDDGTFTDLQNAYRDDTRVLLLQNSKSAGFMNTCYEGVDLVKSKWVTFMYDDDVLSPYFIKMVSELIRSDDRFVMGYGAAFPAGEIYPFKPIDTFKRYRPEQLLLAYYGRNSELDFKGLPHSPICCVTTLDLLHEWVPYVKDFCSRNSIRSYFMLKRNIGPDLMIYLLSLLKHEGNISLCVSVILARENLGVRVPLQGGPQARGCRLRLGARIRRQQDPGGQTHQVPDEVGRNDTSGNRRNSIHLNPRSDSAAYA